jgi:hypothetical protein
MKRLALLAVLAASGCADEGADPDEFPVEPGGDHSTGIPTPTDPGTAMLRGRVCVAMNLLNLSACRANNLAGFMVSIGGQTAMTNERGEFAVPAPSGSLLDFTVSGPGAVTTTTPFSPSLTLPVIDADVWARALASNQIFGREGTGAILGNVVRGGVPAAGIEVSSSPIGEFAPLFDTEGPEGPVFGPDRTGARGVFFLPGIAAGSAGLTFRDPTAAAETNVAGVSVINGGVTILDSVALP